MKINIILILLSITLIIGCKTTEAPKDGFIVTGDINGLGNSKITVIKFVNDGLELDSIMPINNFFTYTGKVKEPYFVQLLVKSSDSTSNKLTEFMIENSEITISGNSIEYDSITVSGSKSDQVLKEYFNEDGLLNAQWDKLKIKYDLAVEEEDTIQRKTLAKELNKIFKVDRVDLLKKYVSNHSNSTVGALIPAFCTIEDALTPQDYQEIFDMLSDSIKVTGYGQNILENARVETE